LQYSGQTPSQLLVKPHMKRNSLEQTLRLHVRQGPFGPPLLKAPLDPHCSGPLRTPIAQGPLGPPLLKAPLDPQCSRLLWTPIAQGPFGPPLLKAPLDPHCSPLEGAYRLCASHSQDSQRSTQPSLWLSSEAMTQTNDAEWMRAQSSIPACHAPIQNP